MNFQRGSAGGSAQGSYFSQYAKLSFATLRSHDRNMPPLFFCANVGAQTHGDDELYEISHNEILAMVKETTSVVIKFRTRCVFHSLPWSLQTCWKRECDLRPLNLQEKGEFYFFVT